MSSMNIEIKDQLLRLNEISNDIFGEERRISNILKTSGFDDEQIAYCQADGIQELITNIDFALRAVLLSLSNGCMLYSIVYHRYGLFGKEKQTLEQIGRKYGISRERVRQVQVKILGKLRCGIFERIIIVSACQSLNIDVADMIHDRKIVSESHNQIMKQSKTQRPFTITTEMLQRIAPQQIPLSINEFVKKLNAIKPDDMVSLQYHTVTEFLNKAELLETYTTPSGKTSRRPTESGESIGIFTEQREGKNGQYTVILYNKDAQQFLIDNMEAIISEVCDKNIDDIGLQGSKWSEAQEECLIDLYQKQVPVSEIAVTLKRTPKGIHARLKKLGLIAHRSDAK